MPLSQSTKVLARAWAVSQTLFFI